MKLPKPIRVVLTDIVGVTLLILSLLLGWLPGPGGIPLFLAGLRVLAINHEWAQVMFDRVKESGVNVGEYIFRDHPVLKTVYDALSVVMIIVGFAIINSLTGNAAITVGSMVLFTGLTLFLGNRKRLSRINRRLRRFMRRG